MDSIRQAAEVIAQSDAIVILAGAGMGVDSGLPDFRGREGFWQAYPALAQTGHSFEDIANPQAFETTPELAWGFYGHRLNLYRHTEPHYGFKILKKWANTRPGGYFIYTSNVDGQFQKAGFDSERIVECHGSIHRLQSVHGYPAPLLPADEFEIEVDIATLKAKTLPYHPQNNELLRPNILMFNDWFWQAERTNQQTERYQAWLKDCRTHKLKIALVEIGAGHTIATVRHQSRLLRSRFNATYIQINPKPDYKARITIPLGALEALDAIDRVMQGKMY
jgi:NAD-dependent SIR2 family protein deacetylase